MYAGILFGVFSAMSEIADRLRISKLKEFVETLNDPIHEMVKNEMLANPTVRNYFY